MKILLKFNLALAFCLALGVSGGGAWAQNAAQPAPALQAPGAVGQTPGKDAPAAGAPDPSKPAKTTKKRSVLNFNPTVLPLGGALNKPDLWAAYKARFVTETGRVVDTGSGMISHSEGQGYGMLLAVAANDHVAFDRIWSWTRANLMVRDDSLLAWRWEPDKRPAIADMNNASDGDILVAWALTEAAEFWQDQSYRAEARRIAVEAARKTVLFGVPNGPLLLPGVSGFAREDRSDGPILNLSYWVFPAFQRLPLVAAEFDWRGLTRSGLDLLQMARLGPAHLPPDWISLHDDKAEPAAGFPRVFSYNAVRIPLYLAMAGVGTGDDYEPYVALWGNDQHVSTVDIDSGSPTQSLGEAGYDAIAALTLCAAQNRPFPPEFRSPRLSANYYPATLQLLALIAAQMRYKSCFRS